MFTFIKVTNELIEFDILATSKPLAVMVIFSYIVSSEL